MKRQTAMQAQAEAIPKQRNNLLRHAAVRPIADHDGLSLNGSSAQGVTQDLTQVPVRTSQAIPSQQAATSCSMSPQRCPFGGACHSCPPHVQAKLKIGQPGDKYEQEADQVAEQVMRMPEPQVQRKGCSSPNCKKDDEDEILQAKSTGKTETARAHVNHPLIQKVLSSPGQPLDAVTRGFMEPRFGQDFSGVRVHTGGQAADSAQAVNAQAYTVGRNVVFGEGKYAPESCEGRRLVAHELVHSVQQTGGALTNIARPTQSSSYPAQPWKMNTARQVAVQSTAPVTVNRVAYDSPLIARKASPDQVSTVEVIDARSENELTAPVLSEVEPSLTEDAQEANELDSHADPVSNVEEKPENVLEAESEKPEQSAKEEHTQTAPEPSDAGAVPGAPTGADAITESVSISAKNPGDILTQLASVPPSSAFDAYSQAESISATVLEKQKDAMQATLPEIPVPTGLDPKGKKDDKKGSSQAAKPSVENFEGVKNGREGEQYDTKVPDAPPAPPPKATILRGKEEGTPEADTELARNARDALGSVGFSSSQISTHSGPGPQVDLTGEADPSQMAAFTSQSNQEVLESKSKAEEAIYVEHGENSIYPDPSDGTLKSDKTLSVKPTATVPGGETPILTPDVATGLDASLGPVLKQRIGEKSDEYAAGKTKSDSDVSNARQKADTDIADKKDEARENQLSEQKKTQDEVAGFKQEWQKEIDGVTDDYKEKANKASTEQRSKVLEEKKKAEKKANKHLDDAEKKATKEKTTAAKKAQEEKQKTKKKSSGFWGWAKSKASALIDGLKAVVKGIFKLAKKLCQAVIELARMIIVGLIKGLGMILKGLVSVVLVAFPEIADRINREIDTVVNAGVEAVNKAAQVLKDVVGAILDFLANAIDSILGFIQGLWNGLFTLTGMLIRGEFKQIIDGISNLIAAAEKVPELFEIAAYEELLGGDLDKPLSPEELAMASMAGITIPGKGTATPGGGATEGGAMPSPPWTTANVGVDEVADNMVLSPEIIQELFTRMNGAGGIEIAFSDDPARTMASVMSEIGGQKKGGEPEQAKLPDDGLTPMQRAEIKWELMKDGLAKWWNDNKVYIIAGSIAAIVGTAAAIFFSGGSVLAAIPPLMSVLGPLFLGATAAVLAGHVRDYVTKSWEGDIRGGGKSLAKGLAAGAIELISWLTFKAGGAVLKGAKAVAKGGVKLAKAAIKGIKASAKFLIKNGKVLFKGIKNFAVKQFKSLKDFGKAMLQRMRLRRFRIRVSGRVFILEGYINPWISIGKWGFPKDLDDLIKAVKDPNKLNALLKKFDNPKALSDFRKAARNLDKDELRKLVDEIIKKGGRVDSILAKGRKVITYASKDLDLFLSKLSDTIKKALGFNPFVSEMHHVIPSMIKGPDVRLGLKSLFHRLKPSSFTSRFATRMSNLKNKLGPAFKNMPLNNTKKFKKFVKRLPVNEKNLLEAELKLALRETYQEMFKGDALKLALERLDVALKQWAF